MSEHQLQRPVPQRNTYQPASAAILQRACACGKHATDQNGECTECRKKRLGLQRRAVGQGPDVAPPIVHDVLRSPGRPLDDATRGFMESRFNHDFSGVRVHTDGRAAESARAVNALAYTVGRNVVFGERQYAPDTLSGRRLLAHELTHTVQQGLEPSQPEHGLQVGPSDSAYERIAEAHEQLSTDSKPLSVDHVSPGNILQRDNGAPIERERSESLNLRLDHNLIRLSLDVLRGEHRLSAEAGLTNPVSVPLDLLGVDLGIDSSRLQAILSYENRCNWALQSALVRLEAGPFIGVNRVPWRVTPRVGVRIGSLRFDPGVELGFEGSDFDSVLFTLNLAEASTGTPPECIAPPRPAPPSERETPPPSETGRREETPETPPPPSTPTTPTTALPTYRLHFQYDSTFMRPESHDSLQHVVELLQFVPRLRVQLTGHTSLEGTTTYNQRLSEQRAEAVRDRLVLAGIDTNRIRTLGMGEASPIAIEPNIPRRSLLPSVEDIRTLNRRVDVTFFDPTGQFESQFPDFSALTSSSAPPSFSLGVPKLRLGR